MFSGASRPAAFSEIPHQEREQGPAGQGQARDILPAPGRQSIGIGVWKVEGEKLVGIGDWFEYTRIKPKVD